MIFASSLTSMQCMPRYCSHQAHHLLPLHYSTAPNVEWLVDDLEEPWTYNTKFDFIYLRCMSGSIKDWPKLFRQAYE